MKYTCTVCGFAGLEEPPAYFTICPCCGTEFGYQDFVRGHDDLLADWVGKGMQWQSTVTPRPYHWNPIEQLVQAGLLQYESTGEESLTEIGFVEIAKDSVVVPLSTMGNARINTVQYAVGHIVDKLMNITLVGVAQPCSSF